MVEALELESRAEVVAGLKVDVLEVSTVWLPLPAAEAVEVVLLVSKVAVDSVPVELRSDKEDTEVVEET